MTDTDTALAGLQVLVVDDQDAVRTLFEAFVQAAGGTPHAFADGASCLAALPGLPRPDVLVTDFNMPGMDGVELLTALRRVVPDLPAVVCTGYPADVHVDSLPGPPAVVLPKPLLLAELLEAIAAARGLPGADD